MFDPPTLGAREPDAHHIAQAIAIARTHLKQGVSTYAACAKAAAALLKDHGLTVPPKTIGEWLMHDFAESTDKRTPSWED